LDVIEDSTGQCCIQLAGKEDMNDGVPLVEVELNLVRREAVDVPA
jgi:hypothetical protein